MYVKTSYTSCNYITAGKVYEVIDNDEKTEDSGHIVDDTDRVINIYFNCSSHINYTAWKVVGNIGV